jgi:hypothetical protein
MNSVFERVIAGLECSIGQGSTVKRLPSKSGREGSAVQSIIRMRVACRLVRGAWIAVPIHEAIEGVDLPESVMSTSSIPNTEGGPCVCRLTAMVAANLSPSCT